MISTVKTKFDDKPQFHDVPVGGLFVNEGDTYIRTKEIDGRHNAVCVSSGGVGDDYNDAGDVVFFSNAGEIDHILGDCTLEER